MSRRALGTGERLKEKKSDRKTLASLENGKMKNKIREDNNVGQKKKKVTGNQSRHNCPALSYHGRRKGFGGVSLQSSI